MSRLVYVGHDDDISDLAGRLQGAGPGEEVVLVVPPGAQAFQTPLHLRLLGQLGAKRGGRVVVVSPDARIQEQARGSGITAFSSLPAYEEGVPVVRRPVDAAGSGPGAAAGTGSRDLGAGARAPSPPAAPAGSAPAPLPAGAPISAAGDLRGTGPGEQAAGIPPVVAGPWSLDSRPIPVAPAPAPAPAEGHAAPAPTGPDPHASPPPLEEWTAPGGQPVIGPGPFSTGGPAPQVAGGPGTAVAAAPPRPLAAPPGAGGRGTGLEPVRPVPPRRRRPRASLYFLVIGVVVLGGLVALALTPTATVTITVQEQPITTNPTIQGGTAAPQPKQANYIQTRVVSTSGSQQFTADPTGTKSIPAAAATGSVVLSANPGYFTYGVSFAYGGSSGTTLVFQTSGGVQFQATGSGTVDMMPPTYQSAPIAVQAVRSGSAGNVASGAVDQWVNNPCDNPANKCSASDFTVSNPSATTGGADAQQQTVASATDVQGWVNQVSQICSQLTSKARTTLTAKAAPDRLATDPGQGGETISCTPSPDVTQISPGTQASSQTVTVSMTAQAVAYNPTDLEEVVYRDLLSSNSVSGPALPAGDTLVSKTPKLSNIQVIQAASDGTLALSVTGTGFYRPAALNLSTLRDKLTGHSPSDVPGIVQSQISDIKNVTVSEHPFTLFFMPFFSSRITIKEKFVAPAAGS